MDFSASTVLLLTIFCCLWNMEGRKFSRELSVPNGGKWGNWGPAVFCNKGYANGFSLKVEKDQLLGDNTALNGIRLYCTDGTAIESKVGPWGTWTKIHYCKKGNLFAFSLRVEPWQKGRDDTAANNIQFICSDGNDLMGLGKNWGEWGRRSHRCLILGICGMKTKVEDSVGFGDNTALNDVVFYCCDK